MWNVLETSVQFSFVGPFGCLWCLFDCIIFIYYFLHSISASVSRIDGLETSRHLPRPLIHYYIQPFYVKKYFNSNQKFLPTTKTHQVEIPAHATPHTPHISLHVTSRFNNTLVKDITMRKAKRACFQSIQGLNTLCSVRRQQCNGSHKQYGSNP